MQPEQRVDVVYSFCGDNWGNGGLEMRVKDMRPADGTTAQTVVRDKRTSVSRTRLYS